MANRRSLRRIRAPISRAPGHQGADAWRVQRSVVELLPGNSHPPSNWPGLISRVRSDKRVRSGGWKVGRVWRTGVLEGNVHVSSWPPICVAPYLLYPQRDTLLDELHSTDAPLSSPDHEKPLSFAHLFSQHRPRFLVSCSESEILDKTVPDFASGTVSQCGTDGVWSGTMRGSDGVWYNVCGTDGAYGGTRSRRSTMPLRPRMKRT
eukprot:3018638-Rhodomonas_salina.2